MKKYKIKFRNNRFVDILIYDKVDELLQLSDVFNNYILDKADIENGYINIGIFVTEYKNNNVINSFKEFYYLNGNKISELFEILSLFYKKLGYRYLHTSFSKIAGHN